MKVHHLPSPNCEDEINVRYLVLHYTAIDLASTLKLFLSSESKVSAHIVISEKGEIYEMVPCLEGKAVKAYHAGTSYYQNEQNINQCSIGIELVNKNGNLFEYTRHQYEALGWVVSKLKDYYSNLCCPKNVLGHEHIAGFRGKVDPGFCFDWPLFYRQNYPNDIAPSRGHIINLELQSYFNKIKKNTPSLYEKDSEYWQNISLLMELMAFKSYNNH